MKKKHYIPTLLIVITLIVSVYYVFFRQNDIEVRLEQGRFIFNQHIRNIELDRFPLRLPLEFERFWREFQNIQLRKEWTAELTFDLTLQPFFDLRNVYLVSFDKIAVYDKNTMENIWLKQIDNVIESFTLIDGNNLLVVDTDGTAYAINRNTGEMSWSHDFDAIHYYFHSFVAKPLQISNTVDRRLLTSVIIFPTNNEIHILDNVTGEIQFTMEFDDQIFYISDYDPIEHAIYVAYGNNITKLILETR